ncbi:hypothetical protein ACLB2K_071698 [Fragaria x ananassa]
MAGRKKKEKSEKDRFQAATKGGGVEGRESGRRVEGLSPVGFEGGSEGAEVEGGEDFERKIDGGDDVTMVGGGGFRLERLRASKKLKVKMEPTYKSGQQDESRKSARDEEEGNYRITKIQKSYKDDDEVEDSDDEIVLSASAMRRESIMKSLRFMYAAHKDGRLKKRSRTPSPVPSREIVASSPLIDQEVCMLNYVISEPPPENIEHQCLAVYKSKEQNICKLIASMNSKISLSVDLWANSSHQSPDYYMVLTGHFIDDADWNMHHRILNVSPLPSDSYRNHKFIQVILTCLSNWNVRHRLFSLTVDDALCSSLGYHSLDNIDPIIPHLRPYCYARVISGLAQHALGSMSETITKIRRSIQFVLSSQSRHNKFFAVKQHLGIRSKRDVILDEQAKWDTTYHMLVVALKLKNVFGCLSSNDLDYKIVVSIEEWKQVETLITYMNYFFQATKMVNAHQYAYADAFFPVVAKIQGELKRAANSEDPFIKLLTTPLHQKFEKYWESCYNLLAIAYILNPRVKLTTLHQEFSQIYGEQAKERAECS